MTKALCIVFLVSFSMTGCAGRQPDPVMAYSPGDEFRNCDELKKEIVDIQNKMLALLPKTDKTVLNTLWWVGGTVASYTPAGAAASFVPYLFIDMKDAERIEYNALARRHNRLLLVAQTKEIGRAHV
jgi:hypothetical protein